MTTLFEKELETYSQRLEELMPSQGKFVLVKDTELYGPFDTYEGALAEGYGKFGLDSFMVKQIESPGHGHLVTRLIQICP